MTTATLPTPEASASLLSMRKKRPTFKVGLDAVRAVPVPASTATWTPTPHAELIDHVLAACEKRSLTIRKQDFSLSRDKGQMYGILVMRAEAGSDFSLAMGVRNSIDKSMPVGLAAGANVLVCDNDSFSAEVVIKRKHTTGIHDALPGLVAGAIDKFLLQAQHQSATFARWKEQAIDLPTATDLIVRAAEEKIIPCRAILPVRAEFIKPRHTEFGGERVWTLYNAFTQYLTHDRDELVPSRVQDSFLNMHKLVATYSANVN